MTSGAKLRAREEKLIVHFIFDEVLRVDLGIVKDDEDALIVQPSGTRMKTTWIGDKKKFPIKVVKQLSAHYISLKLIRIRRHCSAQLKDIFTFGQLVLT